MDSNESIKEFERAQKFVINELKKAKKSNSPKKAFDKAISNMENELRTSENLHYKRSMLFLINDIAEEFEEFVKKYQSQ